jgi:hypothetical protein
MSMPRYHRDDVAPGGGVHRRRLERRGSNTPIIVGGCIVGLAMLVFLGYAAGLFGRRDPEKAKEAIKTTTRHFLLEARHGNRDKIFKEMIDVTGGKGWIFQKLGHRAARRYRMWDDPSFTDEEKEENRKLRIEQNDRMWLEISTLCQKINIEDDATLERVVAAAEPKLLGGFATITLRHANGELELTLAGHDESWVVQYWELKQEAM